MEAHENLYEVRIDLKRLITGGEGYIKANLSLFGHFEGIVDRIMDILIKFE